VAVRAPVGMRAVVAPAPDTDSGLPRGRGHRSIA
jgi:hypothetical protein